MADIVRYSCSWKRLLILLLSLTMIITLMPPSVFAENDSSTDITDSTNTSFSDVKSSDYFYSPVNWAVQNEITKGTTSTTFSPDQGCTRAQAITFLWRLSGRLIVSTENNFDDVKDSDYYAEAVNWAVSRSITKGTGGHKFDPDAICTRAQIVTFLARFKEVSPYAEYPDSGFSDVNVLMISSVCVGLIMYSSGFLPNVSENGFVIRSSPFTTCYNYKNILQLVTTFYNFIFLL